MAFRAFEVIDPTLNIKRAVLYQQPEGVYVALYTDNSEDVTEDYLQDDFEMAVRACEIQFGIDPSRWREIVHSTYHFWVD